MESPTLAAKEEHDWHLHKDPDMERRLAYIQGEIDRYEVKLTDMKLLFQKTEGLVSSILGHGYLGD